MPVRRFARGERLVLATHNPHKIAELRAMLSPAGLVVMDAATLGLAAPDETAEDFAGNALTKARVAASASGLPAFADDSGFAVEALGGAPGVFSARWADQAGNFAVAMRRVRDEAAAHANRRARFVCVIAVAWPDGRAEHFTGRIDGSWVWPPRGGGGFGYDPIFVPDGDLRTFAEMNPGEKASISHRAIAFAAFAAACLP